MLAVLVSLWVLENVSSLRQLCQLPVPPLSGPFHFPANPNPSRGPVALCSPSWWTPELLDSWELEQSRGVGRRRVSPEPHRSQPLDPATHTHTPRRTGSRLKIANPRSSCQEPAPGWFPWQRGSRQAVLIKQVIKQRDGRRQRLQERGRGLLPLWVLKPLPSDVLTGHLVGTRPRSCFCPMFSAWGERLCVLSLSFLLCEWE